MMDEMDGYTFFENITNNDEHKSIPFIFLTAKNMENDRIKGLSKGAIDYISKPFSINELLAKIESIIKYQELTNEIVIKNIGEEIFNYLKFKSNLNQEAENIENNNIDFDLVGKMYLEYGITQKELEIINLLKKGFEYKEIASFLKISINTVRTYIKRIFKKCNVRSSREVLNLIDNY
jgi:DNA-binding NarL/FixJ family response regulator